ncbi:Gfo/Idh/MocA family protein [Roseibacillus ishigakijimensis]|uniref:Gfo/Idh/MocA family oxidoreductase n=1 Tax=Roseibacillus ishigakijimensis TaxID=454146 RepID=A0A934RTI3_9BACT|nr:Gfo/Idh/MocA family oxidoreductase [Roseibacillus ishigakijimensis]MBK1833895.1 Gfo/Idh/MocA family oxidoreductase [Roseibacillus ishigakijimensis]
MSQTTTRRQVLKTATAAGTLAAISAPHIAKAQAGNNDTIKVGIIGCGGRGTGAITQALNADANTKLWAAGDAFQDRLDSCLSNIASFEDRAKVPAERQFTGIDCYQGVLDSGVDVVILTAPPGFRPEHIAAAVDKGVHMFIEKPMAVDPAGLRAVLDSVKKAKEKNLTIQNGFCWRFHPAVKEAYGKILSGEYGRVNAVYGTYLAGPVRPLPNDAKKPSGMSMVEWQVANWINFDWLSGGPLVEQAIHTTDKVAWAMNDAIPIAAVGNGGKIARTDPGNVYDHTNVTYEYADNVFCHVAQRQIQGVHTEVIDRVTCDDATVIGPGRCYAKDHKGKMIWRSQPKPGEEQNMYQVEHNELFAALRAGKRIDGGEHMINSTAHALLGAFAAQTGKRITWDELWNSELDLAPEGLTFKDDFEPQPLPIPGKFSLA